MKLAIELSDKGPYERVSDDADSETEQIIPTIGDTIIWSGISYVVKERLIDYDEDAIVIRAAT